MKIVPNGFSLSEDDIQLLTSTETLEKLMSNRLVVEFDETPELEALDFTGCQGFYHIKSLGNKLYQFWFEMKQDYDAFYENILAYKMTLTNSDK